MLRDLLDAVRRSGLDRANTDIVASATRHLATSTEGDGELEAALAQILADAEELDAVASATLRRYVEDVHVVENNDGGDAEQEESDEIDEMDENE